MRTATNRDKKTSFSAAGTANIWWLVSDFAYTRNFWSCISDETRLKIMQSGAASARLATLFESCLGLPVSRIQVAAVAAQDDYMKRLRKNGGARDILSRKGIALLYSGYDRDLLRKLEIQFGHREFVSIRPANSIQEKLLREAGKIE